MYSCYDYTKHARERSSTRLIPQMIIEIIMEFGKSYDSGNGTRKYVLDKVAMRHLRKLAGRSIADAISPYRNRNVYVVATGSRIVTAAFASRPHHLN